MRPEQVNDFVTTTASYLMYNSEHVVKYQALLYCVTGVQCIPQRAALLKSMLNFLKKAIQDPAFSDGIRHGKKVFDMLREMVCKESLFSIYFN